jgi:multidrug resistance protein, MATE family
MNTNEISSGSLKEVWRVTLPLMISSLSMFTMFFVDRLFLANYSTAALNAAASAGTLCWSAILFWSTLAMMAEIFVSQYNGAKRYEKLGEPVWQMIWLSAGSILFFIPMAIWGSGMVYASPSQSSHAELARWVMFMAPLFAFQAALSAFFIGQGKTSIVRWLAILGNLVNMGLDPLFIFGFKGIIPSMGIKGACIATGIGTFVQVVIFAIVFLRKENRRDFGTSKWRFQMRQFIGCIKVGLPPSISVSFEVMGWAVFYWMMTQVSDLHIVTTSLVQSILILFLFFGFGLEKGVATVAGNLIGAGKIHLVRKAIVSGAKLMGFFSLFITICLTIFPDAILNLFLNNPHFIEGVDIAGSVVSIDEVRSLAKFGMLITIFYLVLENTRWLFSGVLTAAGDTLFLMIANTVAVWVFMIIPTYYIVVVPKRGVEVSFWIWISYALLAFSLIYFRYRQGKWKGRNLIEEMEQEPAVQITGIEPEES